MNFGLADRVAVVAGSSKGIGFATAEMLAAEGMAVVINGRDPSRLREAAGRLSERFSTQIMPVVADVSSSEGSQGLIDHAIESFGRIDVLVTNAGGPRPGGFADLTDDDFYEAFATNFMSVVRLIRASLVSMSASRWGRIINIQSSAIREPVPNVTLTNAIRPGVAGLAKDLANELGAFNITINTILVGPTLTDRLRQTTVERARASGITEKEQWTEYLKLVPMGRFGEPVDVAALVTFLASEAAGWITGTAIPADGGRIKSTV